MNLSPVRLIAAIAILVAAGLGIAGFILLDNDDGDGDDSDLALDTTTTSAKVTSSTSPDSSSTTSPPASSSTSAPATTTTTAKPSTTTTASGATTTTRLASGVCGSGTARVSFSATELVTTPTESAFVPQATVENLITKPIEVEELVADVTYPDGAVRTIRFSTGGVVIAPNASTSFTAGRISAPKQYTAARISRFSYFTQGQRDRCRVST